MHLIKYISLGILAVFIIGSCSKDEPTLRTDPNTVEEEEEEVIDTIPDFDPNANWMQQLLYEQPGNEVTL